MIVDLGVDEKFTEVASTVILLENLMANYCNFCGDLHILTQSMSRRVAPEFIRRKTVFRQ